jgi:branched-chain amino acid transport system permease protein
MNYVAHIIVILEIYVILAVSANQKVGMSGLLSLGQAVFYGVGAYVTAISISRYGLPYSLALALAILASWTAGWVFSLVARKVRNLYYSLATLALQVIFFSAVYNAVAVTNGPYGISGIPSPEVFGVQINTPVSFAILGGVWVLGIMLFYLWFLGTPTSRLIEATRDDQIALLNVGKDPNRYKRLSITLSAVVAGIAGSLYASYSSYIDPSSFTLDESILILSLVLIGGTGRLLGGFAGAMFYVLLPEILKFIGLPDTIAANARMILFGLLLIIVVRIRPEGLFGRHLVNE